MIDLRLYTSPVAENNSRKCIGDDAELHRYMGICFAGLRDIQTHLPDQVPVNHGLSLKPKPEHRIKIKTKVNTVELTLLKHKGILLLQFEDPIDATGSALTIGMVDGRIYNVIKHSGKFMNEKGTYSFQQSTTLFSTFNGIVKNPKPFKFEELIHAVESVELLTHKEES